MHVHPGIPQEKEPAGWWWARKGDLISPLVTLCQIKDDPTPECIVTEEKTVS